MPLKERQPIVREMLMNSLGVRVGGGNKSGVVNWENFINFQAILKFFTASKE
jgi:hypothetical protein